jgi:hypothetical protein
MNGENRLLVTDELVEFVIQSGLYKCYPYISVIISYLLRNSYSPTKTQLVRLVSVMC